MFKSKFGQGGSTRPTRSRAEEGTKAEEGKVGLPWVRRHFFHYLPLPPSAEDQERLEQD